MWNHPKNRCWRRCCMTGTCCMIQFHSTHCNSCGYDWISLAAVMWHHTAALRRRAAALRCHTAALRQLQDTLRCCRSSEIVTFSCWTSSVIAAQLCVRLRTFRHKRKALCTNPPHKNKIIHDPGYVHLWCVGKEFDLILTPWCRAWWSFDKLVHPPSQANQTKTNSNTYRIQNNTCLKKD